MSNEKQNFKEGDIVFARVSSNEAYVSANLKNKFYGKVIKVEGGGERILLECISHVNPNAVGFRVTVDAKHYKLSELPEPPLNREEMPEETRIHPIPVHPSNVDKGKTTAYEKIIPPFEIGDWVTFTKSGEKSEPCFVIGVYKVNCKLISGSKYEGRDKQGYLKPKMYEAPIYMCNRVGRGNDIVTHKPEHEKEFLAMQIDVALDLGSKEQFEHYTKLLNEIKGNK